MSDGAILAVLLFVAGLLLGGGGVWFIMRHFDNERMTLQRVIGQMQQEIAARDLRIPEEEL